ncbi:Na+/H+ antiporter subunit A [Pseudoclavibacter chungangensis]|uniref:Na+/H+ antiporter subunit A n=1 Tax=Pseudoclavibacter chungangensis TaxID=587635 RepID=A0A7J5BYU2_9MICO|nr:Na+/H+ antiporter subunit A [Pseudoclavibacter chungangensis]KAB1659526.1 Na+/H+ antiporter subunit A [Pseudoclavibacter chungangensis]NYJ67611.1 multicomponent Na+:H+ antiporter subunit A [Pseudoclavibacter chungangensis]
MLILLTVFMAVAILIPIIQRWVRNGIFAIGALVPAVAFVVTVLQGPIVLAGGVVEERFAWIPQIGLDLDLRVDTLSWVLALVVTGVGALVLLYCARYFSPDEPNLGRFGGVLLAFAGVMYGLVIADNVYLLFVFWEATSVLSYLLIGHYTGRRASRGAAMQALLVTTLGGLVMLVGLVILHAVTGTASLAAIVASPPPFTGLVITAVMLVLVGAASKSALLPFHFWLPAAMAAPTPVSAYLHAAAMVKAGIYLIARLTPGFADMPVYREVLVTLGIATMLVGGYRALRQYDLKLILAYGTISQLGFLTIVVAFGTRDAALAGITLLVAHACFKATLFLVVGMIDHRTGTRDIRKLSGLGRSAPLLFIISLVAAGSMAGLPPMLGFVAKEAVFTSFLAAGELGDALGWVALIGSAAGAVLTVAYSCRFVFGAFAEKPGVEKVRYVREHVDFMFSQLVLAIVSVVLGIASPLLDAPLAGYADTVPALPPGIVSVEEPSLYHLALWHGLEPALGISAITLALGLLLFWAREPVSRLQAKVPALVDSARGYWWSMRVVDLVAARVTAFTQRGSLPFYLGTILIVFIGATGIAFAMGGAWPELPPVEFSWVQLAVISIMSVAAIAATRAPKRFQGVILVGVTGYGMVMIFALHGAPDLAITQALIESITLVVFVLVLRRLPAAHGSRDKNPPAWIRWIIGIAFGLSMAAIVLFAMASRQASPDSLAFPELAYVGGHGENVVNVTLVDIRGWDTMGELSVLVAAATGIASLIFIRTRVSKPSAARTPQRRRLTASPITEAIELPTARLRRTGGAVPKHQKVWLMAGRSLAPENRSIILEVVVRLVFHALIIVSLYLLFAGHNDPGGGFAGGTVAGLAIASRYLAGGRAELDQAVRVDAGRLLGVGLLMATLTALVPLFFGQGPLASAYIDVAIPYVGQFVFVTSTFFDIGVYLVVIALVIDVLRSLGAEVDLQAEQLDDDADDGELTVTPMGSIADDPVVEPANGTRTEDRS